MLTAQIALLSDRGGRAYNEDACGHWQSECQLCCVLADGAGGHGGGDIASRLVVQDLVTRFARSPSHQAAELEVLLRQTNEELRARREPGTVSADMHSTAVALVLDFATHQVHWAHVGDSRLYWLREGHLLRRTRDHSLVQSLLDAGLLQEAEVRDHPKRSELHSAMGLAGDATQISAGDGNSEVQSGDVFLLCTDGLWEYVEDAELERSLLPAGTPQTWLEALAQRVRVSVAHKRSHDNFSAIAVWIV